MSRLIRVSGYMTWAALASVLDKEHRLVAAQEPDEGLPGLLRRASR